MPNLTEVPNWIRDAVFYQIFPDRFATSHRVVKPQNLEPWDSEPTVLGYKGGDLFGIIEHIDHIEALGANALYLTPVFRAASNHRYNTHDFYTVDPLLGGNQALSELIEACHRRGIKVILDGVFNHCGRGFFQFNDIVENGRNSPYLDWYHIHSFPLNAYNPNRGLGYEAWWGLPTLPKFNTQTPAVREFLWNVATYWLNAGIDGWRLDVPNEIDDDEFWREFRRRCREVNPDSYLVGEIWEDATRWLQGDQFDGITNYEFAKAIIGFVGAHSLNLEEIKKCGYRSIPPLTAEAFSAVISNLSSKYRHEAINAQLNFIGSHDTPRVLTVLGGDEAAVRLAMLFQMTYLGAPCIFYGDEIGIEGGHDPYNRVSMPWQNSKIWNRDLLQFVKRLIRLRRDHAALRRGAYQELYAKDGLYVFTRVSNSETLTVALNAGNASTKVEFALTDFPGIWGGYRDLLGNGRALVKDGFFQGPALPARTGALYLREK
ncbi:MAG: alpha-amylase [Deltaproteobacteria bacterium]|nr:alpha-amylase [Deltaproteobacteria bacterium]